VHVELDRMFQLVQERLEGAIAAIQWLDRRCRWLTFAGMEDANPRPGPPVVRVDALATAICPLFTFDVRTNLPLAFLGTGFLLADGLLVTCWHCVEGAVSSKASVSAVVNRDGTYELHPLRDIGKDASGRDLASARLDLTPEVRLRLADKEADYGEDVATYGYPLTEPPNERRAAFLLSTRYLEGYVTRMFRAENDAYGVTPSYELDMRAPSGLSGAPLIRRGSIDVVGVIYGVNETHSLAQEAVVREGDVVEEVRRIEHFALAHLRDSLADHRSVATEGRRLEEFLNAQSGR
jgi:Trypsin-like peptidase domain